MSPSKKYQNVAGLRAVRAAACTAAFLVALGVSESIAVFADDNSVASIFSMSQTPAAPETPAARQPYESNPPIVPTITTPAPPCDSTGAPKPSLCSLIAPSEESFSNFISPISNPVFFEDPRTLTEAKFIFLNDHLPSSLGGNNFQLYALQLRFALTDRLSIIATKDGYMVSESDVLDDGWANLSAGLKYNLYKDAANQRIFSVGAVFQIPVGSGRSLQGNGDGEFDLFASGGIQLGECWHLISTTGFRLACDTNDQTDSWYWSNHIDRKLTQWGLYALYEVNWYHWMRSAGAFPLPVDGLDLANLGATGVAGNNVVTNAVGLKWCRSINQEIGIAWEFPLTSDKDIMADRLNFNWIIRY